MNLSKEQIKKILDEAPEGATHWWQFLCGDYIGFYGTYDEDISFSREMWNRMPLSDLRKQLDKAEWKNGDECMYLNERVCVFIGMRANSSTHCIIETKDSKTYMPVNVSEISKPETEAEKVERERLESAYDLYCDYQSVNSLNAMLFDAFKSNRGSEKRDGFLAIVDKTKYRKEVE